MTPRVRRIAFDEALFAPLLAEGRAGDGPFLLRLAEEWRQGLLRFDGEREVLLGVFLGDTLAAVGGISRDPYAPAPGLGRVRHVYVASAQRRRGLGRLLLAALLDHAQERFDLLRLRTGSPPAAAFYESLGFRAREAAEQTHELFIRRSSAGPDTSA